MMDEVDVTREGDSWLADVMNLPGAHTWAKSLTGLMSNVIEVIRLVDDLQDGAADPERTRFDAAHEEEEDRLRLAEMVYNARMAAGLTQSELAARAGTRQSVISAIENGAQIPTIPMLRRIAAAVNQRLSIELAAAS